MPTQKLTNGFVNKVMATNETVDYRDTEIAGFHLRVSPGGKKTYRFTYRDGAGRGAKRSTITIGRSTELSADAARRRAAELAVSVRSGQNPAEERRRDREQLTLDALWELFLQQHLIARKKAKRTIEEYERDYRNRIGPRFGKCKLTDLKTSDIELWVRQAHRYPRRANHALAVLSSMLGFALKTGLLDGKNPCASVDRFPENTREVLYGSDEIGRYVAALDQEADDAVKAMFRLIIGTGCRSIEAKDAEWAEFDFHPTSPRWNIPARRMKQRKPHTYLISTGLAEYLQQYRREAKLVSPIWAFPAPDGQGPRHEIRHVHRRIEQRSGIEHIDGRGLHAFRRSLLTEFARHGANAAQIKAVAGHADIQTAMKYVKMGGEDAGNRDFIEKRNAILSAIETK
jgi:integrase